MWRQRTGCPYTVITNVWSGLKSWIVKKKVTYNVLLQKLVNIEQTLTEETGKTIAKNCVC